MKKIVVLTVLAICASASFAQDEYELKKLTVTGGKSAITSGLDAKVIFQKGNKVLGAQANYQRVYALYGYELPFKTTVMFTSGAFQNAPWAGAEVISCPIKGITLVGWYGHVLHKEGEEFGWDPQPFFTYVGVFLNLKSLTLSYAVQEFNGWMNLPGI